MLIKANKPIYRTFEDFPYEDLLLYAGIDCITTSELLAKTWPVIANEPQYASFDNGKETRIKLGSIAESMAKYTMPAFEFICDMEINGIKYDVEKNKQLCDKITREIDQLEKDIFKAIGKTIDLNSGEAVAEFLYKEKGFTPPYFTKTGEPSVDGDALQELAKSTKVEYLKWIGKRNDLASVWRTFLRDYVEEHVKRDGRIHPSYNLNGTSSFRITGDNPNLTQLPRAKHGYNIRECFTVSKGNIFLAFDFSSAEVKVLGALCRDPKLLQAIREGKDFHSFSASAMYEIPYETFIAILKDGFHTLHKDYKEKRQFAKALSFGILYGSSAQGVAFSMGVSLEKAQQLIDMYFKLYPLIEAYVKNSHDMAVANNYVVTPFMQRKWEYGTRSEFKYTAAYNACKRNAQNVRVQSTTSTLGLYCFTQLNNEIKKIGGKSLCTVYDSIELEVPIERAAEAIELGFYYMDDHPQKVFDWLDFPIGVDAEIGFNWGDLHKVKRGTKQNQILALLQ